MKNLFMVICCFLVIQHARAGFYDAAATGDMVAVNNLLEAGGEVNAGRPALHGAIRYKHPEIARILIDAGININRKTPYGQTPLHMAARYGAYEIACMLLATAADIEAKNNAGQTPLHVASLHGHDEIVRILLARRAKVNLKDTFWGSTPLYLAVYLNSFINVKLLLDAHANTAIANKMRQTPLHYAAHKGYKESTELLLQAHADPNLKDMCGLTPLHNAAYQNQASIVKLLLKAGANTRLKSKRKITPLQAANRVKAIAAAQAMRDHLSRPELFAFLMAYHPRTGSQSQANVLPLNIYAEVYDQLRQLDR